MQTDLAIHDGAVLHTDGGAVFHQWGSATFTECDFNGNESADYTGAIYSDDAALTPTRIGQQDASHLEITWSDGHHSVYEVRELRLACACAECIDEWSGEARLDPASVPDDVRPLQIQSVGRYAIQISWSDGHSSGIYPFRRLRALTNPPSPALL